MVEGTLSQGVGAFGLRKTRYRGLAKTGLQHVATTSAMNLIRFQTYLQGVPQERGPDVAVLGSGSVKPGFANRVTLPSGFGYSKAWMNRGSIPTSRPVEFITYPWGLGAWVMLGSQPGREKQITLAITTPITGLSASSLRPNVLKRLW